MLSYSIIFVSFVLCALLVLHSKRIVYFVNKFFINILYRFKVVGQDVIPASGGAIIVCNHVSYFDPLILSAVIKRPVRFLVYDGIANNFIIAPLAKLMRVIPIPAVCNRNTVKALKTAAAAVKNGEVIVIFAEGQVQRVGNLLPFTTGFRHILKYVQAPVIPAYLDKVWGTNWKFKNFTLNLPRRLRYPLTVAFTTTERTSAYEVRRAVQELGADAAEYKKDAFDVLPKAFIKSALRRPFHAAMANANAGKPISYLRTLAEVALLSRKLKKSLAGSKSDYVGVMLPPSVESTLTNIALYFIGKIPVNLNYTVSDKFLDSVKAQTGMEFVVSAQNILNKFKTTAFAVLPIEDISVKISRFKRLCCELIALFTPRKILEKLLIVKNFSKHDLATLIFSSGSTGEPKGVMLSHKNITSNVESFISALNLNHKDGLMGVLPFFHSFGYTITLWMPILAGFKVVYHHNPFEAATIGKTIEKHKLSLLIATPTFIAQYIRKCTREQFATLKTLVSGAEKLKEKVAVDFYKKFGLNIYEGYGCTETSPVVSVNLHDVSGYWRGQIGFKEGSVGRPIPQVVTKIVKLENNGIELGANEEGLLCVKGPNVMLGYLNRPDLTNEVVQDGWYFTGDIATCDDEGFIHITDRLSRFSKIAGEMVPHIKPEELLHEFLDSVERVCVVTGVPDAMRGERLIVLHTLDNINPRALTKQMLDYGLPNIWIPKPEDYYKVDNLPFLGSGKLDLKGVKDLALTIARQIKNVV